MKNIDRMLKELQSLRNAALLIQIFLVLVAASVIVEAITGRSRKISV